MPSDSSATLPVRVRAVTWEAEDVLGFELVPLPPARQLPAFTAGAHVDLRLPDGQVRCYSLHNDPRERHRWCVAVQLAREGRGGSRQLHQVVRPGDVLQAGAPRNAFALDETAPFQLFIAGGIGITPLLAMVERAKALGAPWRLHYAARTALQAAFAGRLQALAADGSGTVHLHFSREPGGQRLVLDAALAALPTGGHVYCCGPQRMLDAFERATSHLPAGQVHREAFAAAAAPAGAAGFELVLARAGRTLTVAPGQSILDCLIAAGCEPTWSCGAGVCGTCETRVLEGVPEHRDMVLTEAEQAAGDRMMVCCSGSRSERLVLDL